MSELPEILAKKVEDARKVVHQALETYPNENLAVSWTGGKDSTLALWIIRGVCAERGGGRFPVVSPSMKATCFRKSRTCWTHIRVNGD